MEQLKEEELSGVIMTESRRSGERPGDLKPRSMFKECDESESSKEVYQDRSKSVVSSFLSGKQMYVYNVQWQSRHGWNGKDYIILFFTYLIEPFLRDISCRQKLHKISQKTPYLHTPALTVQEPHMFFPIRIK